jgi:hypothetical protein
MAGLGRRHKNRTRYAKKVAAANAAGEVFAEAERAAAAADERKNVDKRKNPRSNQSLMRSLKYQQKKAEDLSLRNDALKQSISEHSHEVDEAHRAVASQQRKHKRDIEKMDEKLEKESNAKKRKQLDAAKDHDLYKYKMKCMKDELKKYKSLAEKETIARRNTEKKMTTMIHERQKMKKELEKREAEVRKLRDMLVCEKEKTKKAIVDGKETLRKKEKEYSEAMAAIAAKEKKKRSEITRVAIESTAEAQNKIQIASSERRVANNLVARLMAQQQAVTIREANHVNAMEDMTAEIDLLEQLLREKKRTIRKVTLSTGQVVWGHDMLQLVMELIVNGVPVGSINASIVSCNELMFGGKIEIEELPSVWYIRRVRSILLTVAELLAAYRLGNAIKWGQLHTDMTTRRQIPFLNLLLSYLPEGNHKYNFQTVLMSCCIHPEDETAEAQISAIVDHLDRTGKLLQKWQETHNRMFPGDEHGIPDATSLDLGKLSDGGAVSTDTCNAAQKLNQRLIEEIKKRSGDGNALLGEVVANTVEQTVSQEDSSQKIVLAVFCHHHIRNIWMKSVIKCLSTFLNAKLSGDLAAIDPKYRVETNIVSICRAIYKCFSLNCNYAKGQGEDFKYWLDQFHPGFMLLPIARLSGSREDAIFESTVSINWNRTVFVEYLEELLGTPGCDNLLLDSLAIILRSEEMCALCRVCAIIHYSIGMPMRWLAAKSHELSEYNWSVRSMGRAIDILHDALIKIQDRGDLILKEDFMLNIFGELRRVSSQSYYYYYYYYYFGY